MTLQFGYRFPREFPCMEAIDARRDHEIVSGILVVQINKTKKRSQKLIRNVQGYRHLKLRNSMQKTKYAFAIKVFENSEIL